PERVDQGVERGVAGLDPAPVALGEEEGPRGVAFHAEREEPDQRPGQLRRRGVVAHVCGRRHSCFSSASWNSPSQSVYLPPPSWRRVGASAFSSVLCPLLSRANDCTSVSVPDRCQPPPKA